MYVTCQKQDFIVPPAVSENRDVVANSNWDGLTSKLNHAVQGLVQQKSEYLQDGRIPNLSR